ncbi:MAG: DUF4276 family protein [Terrimicrobiaceae bacterium]|nr:DUF4276 family protein [Terrimicrobiaceae bacterium]
MSAHLYIEGAESKEDQIRCREGFRRLLEKSGFTGRLPRLSACGGRDSAFDDFKTAHSDAKPGHFVAMLIDSEDPMADIEKAWSHLKTRDNWEKPEGAEDEQVLFMTTCMESWIVADRETLKAHYGHNLQENALPPTNGLESRGRADVHTKLEHATRNCTNAYKKGKRSFVVLGELNPTTLEPLLPSFARSKRILNDKL